MLVKGATGGTPTGTHHCLWGDRPWDVKYCKLRREISLTIFSCDQAALWMVQSVCLPIFPSVCLYVCHTFWQCSCHNIVIKFSKVITIDKSDTHAKGQDQRSRPQSLKPNLAVSGLWNNAQNLLGLGRSDLFFKVIRQISRSQGTKKSQILTRTASFWIVTLV